MGVRDCPKAGFMSDGKQRPKFHEARESLPEELRPVYDDMVADYEFMALKHHGRKFVSYKIIADLVKEGWRLPTRKDSSG